MKDYYQILGVDKKASKEEIKKAFRHLAHQHHPDKTGGDDTKFKEISEAFQILSDDQKRSQYDMYGSAGPSQAGGQGGPFGGFDFSGFQGANGQGFEFDLGSIFGDFFGGRGRERRGRDISVDIQVTFAEAIFGVERKILINKIAQCDTCTGTGAEPGSKTKTCSTCNGKGKVQESQRSIFGAFSTVKECEKCHGTGQVPEKVCHTCHSDGVIKKQAEIVVAVPAGIEPGEMIRLAGQGEAIIGGPTGDLYIKIHVEKHPIWHREEANLVTDIKVKLSDALLGLDYPLKSLEGDLTLKVPAGTNNGEVLRVKGKGVPLRGGRRGDLLIKVSVTMPGKLSKKAQKLIAELKDEGV
ncbi:MAG: molecular chaperone DnaJ [Candidatus Paceibacterota bacterium]|jgi:molecular chaperone DnaJ